MRITLRIEGFASKYHKTMGPRMATESRRIANVNPATAIPAAGFPNRMIRKPRNATVRTSGSEKSSLV